MVPQVSEECQDLLRRALEPDVGARLSMPVLLAHPWVLQGMPAALRGINAQLLAPPDSQMTTEPQPCGRKRQRPALQHGHQPTPQHAAKRAAVHTLEALLAARVAGPLRQQYGAAAAVAKAPEQQRQHQASHLPPVAEAAAADAATAPGFDSFQQPQQPQQLQQRQAAGAAADGGAESEYLSFPAPVQRGAAAAGPPAAEIQPAPLQPPSVTPASAAAASHDGHQVAANAESPAAAPESSADSEPRLLSLAPAAEEAPGLAMFDSPSSLKQLLAEPVAGSLRQRFGGRKPPLQGRVHSPLGWQAELKAGGPDLPAVDGDNFKPQAPANGKPSVTSEQPPAAAAGTCEDCNGDCAAPPAEELLTGDSPRFLAAAALAESLAADYDAGTGGFG